MVILFKTFDFPKTVKITSIILDDLKRKDYRQLSENILTHKNLFKIVVAS